MKYITTIILTIAIVIFHFDIIDAQKAERQLIDLHSVIVDNQGNPLSDAVISAQEGRYYTKSDKTGQFNLKCSIDAVITIGAKGYRTYVGSAATLPDKIILEIMPVQMSEDDVVIMPFGTLHKRQIVGAVSTIRHEDFEVYDATQSYSSALASRVLGQFGGKDIRGMGYTVIVDGMKRGGSSNFEVYSDMLNLQEIQEISILKDATSRALYGSHADKGIILITTKRGEPNKRRITFTAETGFGEAKSLPEFMKGADYMGLYNEALVNDGLAPKFDSASIADTRSGNNPYKYPDQDYYSSEFLRSYKPFGKFFAEFAGGNMKNQYYLNIGYTRTSSFLKIGEGANEGTNQLNVRGNMDIEINKWIRASLDALSLINFYKKPNYQSGNFWSYAASARPTDFTLLIPTASIISTKKDLAESASIINEDFILGGRSIYKQNLYGDLLLGGYLNGMYRVTQTNMGLDIDLGFLLPNLKFKTLLSFDNYNTYELLQTNSYSVYEPTFTSQDSIDIVKIGEDNFVGTQSTQNSSFYRLLNLSNVLSYNNTFNDEHTIDIVALLNLDSYKETGFNYRDKHINGGLRVNYMLRNKYVAEFSGTMVGSPRFGESEKWGFAPSVGLAWIASEENFLAGSSTVNYLKFKGSYGNIKTDIDESFATYYMYQDMYRKSGSFAYDDGAYTNNRTQILNIGNPDITWIERNELNLGAEALLLTNKLFAEINYFRSKRFNEITRLSNSYLNFFGGSTFLPYENYNEQLNQGFEFGVNYEKRIADMKINVGLNFININPILRKVDELNYGPGLEYRQAAGKAADAIWGYEAIGLFSGETDILSSPYQTFGTVYPGDIKYRDLNKDDIIDDNDRTIIGNSHARNNLMFSLNLKYKNVEIFTYLSAQTGRSSLYTNNYYWVFGDLKYPGSVVNRWAYDPDNGVDTRATATYPRLSTRNSTNNFINSSYWLYNNNNLSIPVIQLTYSLPEKISSILYTRSLSIFARATDVLMVAENKDKMLLNTGSEPQTRWYSIGLKAQF